jgi:hypothetical protein
MKYKEIKKIGQGSFGTVSLVEDDNGDRGPSRHLLLLTFPALVERNC